MMPTLGEGTIPIVKGYRSKAGERLQGEEAKSTLEGFEGMCFCVVWRFGVQLGGGGGEASCCTSAVRKRFRSNTMAVNMTTMIFELLKRRTVGYVVAPYATHVRPRPVAIVADTRRYLAQGISDHLKFLSLVEKNSTPEKKV